VSKKALDAGFDAYRGGLVVGGVIAPVFRDSEFLTRAPARL
jgi:hypothetical protein